MKAKLLDTLSKVENFSGASAFIELPISKEIINLFLADLEISKVTSLRIDEISNDEIILFMDTTIPFHHKNRIELQIIPEIKLPEIELTAEILGGLNKIQLFILGQLADERITINGNKITINIRSLIPPESKPIKYLPILNSLKIETANDKLLLSTKLKVK